MARRRCLSSSQAGEDRKRNVCLIDALRSLGVRVPYVIDGPFWALRDGNVMLQQFRRLGPQ